MLDHPGFAQAFGRFNLADFFGFYDDDDDGADSERVDLFWCKRMKKNSAVQRSFQFNLRLAAMQKKTQQQQQMIFANQIRTKNISAFQVFWCMLRFGFFPFAIPLRKESPVSPNR